MKQRVLEFFVTVLVIFLFVSVVRGGGVREVFHLSYEKVQELITVAAIFGAYVCFRRRRELLFVIELHEESRGPLGEINFALLRWELEHFKTKLGDLRSRQGLTLETDQLDRFAGAFFEINKERQYVGVGCALPSQFEKYYPSYLTQQIGSRRDRVGPPDYRIIIASQQAMLDDLALNSRAARQFFEKHKDAPGGITILQVDHKALKTFPQMQDLRSTEVGVWQFGLTCWFRGPQGNPERHDLSIARTKAVRSTLIEYFIRLNDCAAKVDFRDNQLEFKERTRDEKRQDEENIKRIFA